MKRQIISLAAAMLIASFLRTERETNSLQKRKKKDGFCCSTAKILKAGDNATEQQCQRTGLLKTDQ